MSIQDWGAIGEILGAIGVIVTLLYLATQVRQNTKALRTTMFQSYSARAMDVSDHLSTYADTFEKRMKGEALSHADEIRIDMFGAKLFSQMESVYIGHREGLVEDDAFKARMNGFKRALGNGALDAWHVYKEYDLLPSFVEYVDRELLKDDNAGRPQ